jgi:uncharacterized protein
MVDVGILGAKSNLSANTLLQGNRLFQEFKGSYVENYAKQELIRSQHQIYYWTSEGRAELDFLFSHKGINYPLEIKSGTTNQKKSLQIYANLYKPNLLIKSSVMNLCLNGKILNCPLYLLGNLNQLLDLITAP